jgi:hypothetical protein
MSTYVEQVAGLASLRDDLNFGIVDRNQCAFGLFRRDSFDKSDVLSIDSFYCVPKIHANVTGRREQAQSVCDLTIPSNEERAYWTRGR